MSVKHPFHLQESWVICFFLGLIMLNFPFLHIFNKDVQILGIPLLILYLFIGWPLSIVVIWLFSLLLGKGGEEGDPASRACFHCPFGRIASLAMAFKPASKRRQ